MIKKITFVALIFITVCMPVHAQETGNSYYEKAEDFISEYDMDFDKLKEYPFETLWYTAKSSVKKGLAGPLKIFCRISAVLLLTSFINFFITEQSKQIIFVVNTVAVLVLFSNVFDSFLLLMEETGGRLFDVKNFMTAFLPVLAGISFASGELITSTLYTGFFMISIVTVANFCINVIIPSIKLFMAIGVTAVVSPIINLKPICEMYSKAVKIAMTAAVSVLCFVLTLQTAITQSQDSLAIKTGKFIVGSAVPIIGSALQSAVGSVYSSVGVLKGFFGVAGIIVIINMFLPSIISLAVNWIGYYLMMVLSEILENTTASDILSVFKEVVEIMLSMSVLFTVLLVFSLTVMIKVTQGV
ncbi:MAG: hypothetical protein E7488_00410 [Ruminococcaceae bacterium]|nr:hypothetical protein [Oscillospiraceae bacterium]